MTFRAVAARFALVLTCVLLTSPLAATSAAAQFWQCAPFARTMSGIEIRGNADTWWGQAAGRYARGATPRVGAVLSFQATRRMRVGHVAMVSHIVNDREILLTHANWSRRGAVERDVRAVDVSAAGDWSMVQVWYAPQGGLGTSRYPANGFIYSPPTPDDAAVPQLAIPQLTIPTLAIAVAAHAPVDGALPLADQAGRNVIAAPFMQ